MTAPRFHKQRTKEPTRALARGRAAREMVFLEGLGVTFAALTVVALIVPVWLLLGPPSDRETGVNPLLEACQVGVKRGLLGIPGYAAAAVLFAWGAAALVRSCSRLISRALTARAAGSHWSRTSGDHELWLDGRTLRFRLLPNVEPLAFTAGLLRPRIYVSRGVFTELSGDERSAVLRHERAHAAARDPLRCLLAAVVFETVLLPGGAWLARRYSSLREVRADVAAARAPGGGAALLAALTKVVPTAPPGACGITQATLDGIVLLRTGGGPGKVNLLAIAMAGALVLLALTATIGLMDWHSYVFCPMGTKS